MRTRFQFGAATEVTPGREERAMKAYVENHRVARKAMRACFASYRQLFLAIKASGSDPHAIRNATKTLVAKRDAFKQALAIYMASHIAWNETIKNSDNN